MHCLPDAGTAVAGWVALPATEQWSEGTVNPVTLTQHCSGGAESQAQCGVFLHGQTFSRVSCWRRWGIVSMVVFSPFEVGLGGAQWHGSVGVGLHVKASPSDSMLLPCCCCLPCTTMPGLAMSSLAGFLGLPAPEAGTCSWLCWSRLQKGLCVCSLLEIPLLQTDVSWLPWHPGTPLLPLRSSFPSRSFPLAIFVQS